MNNIELFKDYEHARLQTAEEFAAKHGQHTVSFDELEASDMEGIPICLRRDAQGKLQTTFIPDTHLLAIGATRSGKTTGYVLPTLNVLLKKKNKPSLVISDPKQELYRETAEKFEKNGYRVLMLDFTNYRYSDCWNPLTKYYRLYQKYLGMESLISVVETENGLRNAFRGVVYESQAELDYVIAEERESIFDEIEKGITALSNALIPTQDKDDPFWEDSARNVLCAFLYAMLEDSADGRMTEEQYSFDTILRIFDLFSSTESPYDRGYFSDRPIQESKAYQLAHKAIIDQADKTRSCISSMFASKMNKFRDTAVRRITASNTFEMKELDDGAPTVIFVSYKDEESLHYEVISMFLSNLYTELIGVARGKGGKLQRPFCFLLDEFGNLPAFNDFDKVISACGGRNIWFMLVLQSYAQLYNIYGKETAEIIKDNLNVHVFFGTNNPQTKQEFSEECGKKTIIAPTSALNGSGETIMHYEKDSVALVPVSALAELRPGECIVTQMLDDVLWSRIERSYTCSEFASDNADPCNRVPRKHSLYCAYTYEKRKKKGKDKVDCMLLYPGEKRDTEPNAYAVQEYLKTQAAVTVPDLQLQYDLTYLQAKKLVELLSVRGWIASHATGVRYPVLRNNLLMRKFRSAEAKHLITATTSDVGNAVRVIRRKGIAGATIAEIAEAVIGCSDAEKALDMLLDNNLIFKHNDLYFSAVSDIVMEALEIIACKKRKYNGNLPKEETAEFLKMFAMIVDNQ